MEWLVPHIARINNFCNTLESGQKTYLHIGGEEEHKGYTHHNNMVEDKDDESSLVQVDDEDERDNYNSNQIDLKGQIKRYNEIIQAKTLPVSVIVSDRSNSISSSSPSPASSVTGSDSSRPGDDLNFGRAKCYTYKPAPMVKKSERRFINAEQKDITYWERRKRNNAAAKKSRESRREKEIEVSRRCDLLLKENEGMKFSIMNLQERNKQLENSLTIYKEILIKNNLI